MNITIPQLALECGVTESVIRKAIMLRIITVERAGRYRFVKASTVPTIRKALEGAGLLSNTRGELTTTA
jgi:hypothetical protein